MKSYHIGLDFGTYQTKVCVFDLTHETHEFFQFPVEGYFVPSRIGFRSDGLFEYGSTKSDRTIAEYYYFKIAAAEDEEFKVETFDEANSDRLRVYPEADFGGNSPEFLSAIYLTYVLILVKQKFRMAASKVSDDKGVLGRFFRDHEKEEGTVFTIQLGIPTEWSKKANLRRRRKFENILLISEILQVQYSTIDQFLSATREALLRDVQSILQSYQGYSKAEFEETVNRYGISVYSETAAGLTFILKTKQLRPGYYATMDIGAGSTDISFFAVEQSQTAIRYFASEAYITAANDVYRSYAIGNKTIAAIHLAEKTIANKVKTDDWRSDERLCDALRDVDRRLDKHVYKLFNGRVYSFHKGAMVERYRDQTIILYGGGARLPELSTGKVRIHDSGSPSITITETFLEKKSIDEYLSLINVLPDDGSWKRDFSMLVVALGLSYVKPHDSEQWFEDNDYQFHAEERQMVPHPFNEDKYIYDVISSTWH